MSRGVVYVATSKPYVDAAAMSIGSLRRFCQEPVMLLTDTDAPYLHRLSRSFRVEVVVHNTKEAHAGKSSRILKTQVAKFCPYDTALFLDADTLILKPITALWNMPTDEAPIAMTLGCTYQTVGALNIPHMMKIPSLRWAEEYKLTLATAGPDAPYYSSSTMVWHRTPALLELFRVWQQEWQRLRVSDMPSLARALAITGVKVVELSRQFNARNYQRSCKTVIYTARLDRMKPHYAEFCELGKLVAEIMKG